MKKNRTPELFDTAASRMSSEDKNIIRHFEDGHAIKLPDLKSKKPIATAFDLPLFGPLVTQTEIGFGESNPKQ